jgi:hypothetical protein
VPRGKGKITSLLVDVAALAALHHACDGCKGRVLAHSCCARFDVWVTRPEMVRITGLLPEVAKVCPHLLVDGEFDNVFEDEGGGAYSIEKRDDGYCAFAFVSKGMIRCGIHAAAAAQGLDGNAMKPLECTLWPFTLTDAPPWVLSVDEDALAFHCNAAATNPGLDPTVVAHLRTLLGEAAAEEVETAAAEGKPEVVLRGDWRQTLFQGMA